MYFRLNDDLPGLEAGAVVDADVAAEGLPQIDRPEGLGEDEEAGEREGVGGVAEEEAVAGGEVPRGLASKIFKAYDNSWTAAILGIFSRSF